MNGSGRLFIVRHSSFPRHRESASSPGRKPGVSDDRRLRKPAAKRPRVTVAIASQHLAPGVSPGSATIVDCGSPLRSGGRHCRHRESASSPGRKPGVSDDRRLRKPAAKRRATLSPAHAGSHAYATRVTPGSRPGLQGYNSTPSFASADRSRTLPAPAAHQRPTRATAPRSRPRDRDRVRTSSPPRARA